VITSGQLLSTIILSQMAVVLKSNSIMKKYIATLREPDGRMSHHSDHEMKRHQVDWKFWFENWRNADRLIEGSGLGMIGKIIYSSGSVENRIHQTGTEIIGGFLLLKAEDLNDATEMVKTCPVYDFGGYAEIRELQNQN